MARRSPTDQDRAEVIRRLLFGLARGDDVLGLAAAIEELHLRHNTFPGEVFLRLFAAALEVARVDCEDPLPYEACARSTWASAGSGAGGTARSSSRSWLERPPAAGLSRICSTKWPCGRPTTTSGGTHWPPRSR